MTNQHSNELLSQSVRISVVDSLCAIGHLAWNDLWSRCEVKSVFARYEWAVAWVQICVTNRQLRIYVATYDDQLIGILPLVWSDKVHDTIVLVGDEHADYAAILTDVQITGVFDQLITAAVRDIPPKGKLLLRDIRSDTSYVAVLTRESSVFYSPFLCVGQIACPRATLDKEHLAEILRKKSLHRHLRKIEKLGQLEVVHYFREADILPRMDGFFQQHIERWAATDYPSLFLNKKNCDFYKTLVTNFSESGLLVYTEVLLDKIPVASHFGFMSEHDFIWYKPSFAIHMAKYSPGEVLLFELFQFAGNKNLQGFDFTRGDEPFKARFADQTRTTQTFAIYSSLHISIVKKIKNKLRYRLKRNKQMMWLWNILKSQRQH